MSYRKNANFTPKPVYRKQQLAQMNRAVQQIYGKPKPVRLSNNSMAIVPSYNQPSLKRAAPQEVNYVDLPQASYNLDTNGTVTLLATISQGASVNQRIGKRAYLKSLLIRGLAFSGTATTICDATFLIIYDKRPTGALPAITDILTAVQPSAFMNDNNTGRFEIIRRSDFNLIGNQTTPSTGNEAVNVDMFIPLKKRPITFESAGTGAIGDIDSGALYLVTLSSVGPGTGAGFLRVACRTRFTEK